MLFGQSIFQSVLERLKQENEAAGETEAPATHRVSGFSTGLAFDVLEGVSAASQRVGQAYFDNLGAEPGIPEPSIEEPPRPAAEPEPVMPGHLARTSPEDIAAELAISIADTLQTLNEKRRTFAKANHPDSVAPPFRDNANRRMMIANLLIDEALRRLPR
ncbi:hypothetical protein FHX15_000247 [Rhizobium sp. BK650]|uniref:hypothetical protein n=1 Tax=Rhizobium sp. BK650 TaxID=2586990 RepID=UPI00161B4F42|nr:hypothetical protein [Rhizobium sp. BK650]MBB3655048.1 hypothetical protein [Rhizobium sp. BK650]